ncbi:MAG: hypothetical protein CFH18_00024 [Alphaproteobacteria bacterium MarineAlpha5_Bin8]|nr:MAG: hypothetical protein CFH17_00392 [Alphaproteobacteria bacterium MarineAlpha5_Bin7]PPR48408.1 MAG: hypothetical protein CFH18_00024 [Alphaproteobacteria bacterium MarineAlpha5_Bin8]PPR54405.1 MAG: hypothetical protein CFH16_00438 [Alphaproteobacteria bacterium MarineAlpha5_Bin6]|tara:strand:- start:940 stop:1218 length:279 start_codon:yes stop_codon:yes gene_type:complete
MSKKLLQYIVIFLGILIIFAFIALIYGMYLKISNSNNIDLKQISLNLSHNDKIFDIDVIDDKKLLIVIKGQDDLKAAIYNIKEQKITEFIEK